MKKLYSSNIRRFLTVTIFLLTLSIIVYSCRKEFKETDTLQQPQQSLIKVDIAALKDIYNKAIGSSTSIQTLSKSSTLNFIRTLNVNWDTYTLQKRKDSSIVAEFDMKNDTGLFLLKKLYPGDTVKFVNKTTVTFIKFKDGSRLNFFTKIIEDLTSPGSHSVMNNLHYNQVPNGFSGMILYYTLDRQFINGYRYINGGIQGTVSLTTTPPVTSEKSVNSVKVMEAGCTFYPIYSYDCYSNYQVGNPSSYTDLGCTSSLAGYGMDCGFGGPGGGAGPGGGVGGDTGGGGGGGGTSTSPCTPNFNSNNSVPPVVIESVSSGKRIMVAQPVDNPIGGSGGTGTGSSTPCYGIPELNNALASDNDFLLPCDSLQLLQIRAYQSYGSMYQQVAQFSPSQSIIDRINSLQSIPNFDFDTFNLQNLNNAYGPIVNSDFFPVRITSMPSGMDAAGLTEYFRTHINNFITGSTQFTPYNYGGVNDNVLFNQPSTSSVGALIHINLLIDGTVLESDYKTSSNSASFKFSTMTSPLDNNHPVSGNREFGVYADPVRPGEFTFYTMGVDRTSNWMYATFNATGNGFTIADALWTDMQEQMIKYINANGGQASFYSNKHTIARPDYNLVKDYLSGKIDLATLKHELGC